MRIDAHQHFWTYDEALYGWITENGLTALERDFHPDHLRPLLDAQGIDGTIAVQARQDLAESEWLLDLAGRHPWIRGVVGWVDLVSPDAGAQIDALRARGPLVGIRHVVQDEPAGFLDGEAFRRGVRAVGDRDLTYDVLIHARQMGEAVRFCGAHDGQRLVLDHLGKPPIAEGRMDGWSDELGELGAMDHVWIKLSGLVTEANWSTWGQADLDPYLDRALEAFGPDRLLYGSDWPVCTLAADYDRVRGAFLAWAGSRGLKDVDERATRATGLAYGFTP